MCNPTTPESSQTQLPPISFGTIALLGVLIGAVTSILYSKTFDDTPTRDVFFTALGIPALFVATVSNLTTQNEAGKLVESAASVSQEEVQIQNAPTPLTEEEAAPDSTVSFLEMLLPREAQAQPPPVKLVTGRGFVVVLASYGNSKEAAKAADRWRRTRMPAERFVAKDIRIFRAGRGLSYVTYTGPLPKEEAIRIYRLVKISDSKLTPTVMSLGP